MAECEGTNLTEHTKELIQRMKKHYDEFEEIPDDLMIDGIKDAIEQNNIDILHELRNIADGFNISIEDENECFEMACDKGDKKMVEELWDIFDMGYHDDCEMIDLFCSFVEKGNYNAVGTMIKKGHDYMLFAMAYNDEEKVKEMVRMLDYDVIDKLRSAKGCITKDLNCKCGCHDKDEILEKILEYVFDEHIIPMVCRISIIDQR